MNRAFPGIPGILSLSAALLVPAARPAAAEGGADLVVTSAADVVDGDVSSPDALRARPGSDGISLREALTAAREGVGPLRIALDASLAGRTIALASDLPAITRERVSIVGPTDAAGRPLVTISGSPFRVSASHFRGAGLRMTAARGAVVFVYAESEEAPGSRTIQDIRIEDDVFDGSALPDAGHGVAIGTSDGSEDAIVRDVTVARNAFLGFRGDVAAVLIDAGGTGAAIRGVSVTGNSFLRNSIAVRFGLDGSRDTLSAVTIAGNEFLDNGIAIAAISGALPGRPPSTDGVVEGVRIAGNRIFGGESAAIYLLAGGTAATGLVVRDIDVVDNVIWGGSGFAIGGEAGSGPGSTRNRIEGIRVVNDTIAVGGERSGLAFSVDSYGAEGNSISAVEVLNSIFAGAGTDFAGDPLPFSVSHSIVSDPAFAGENGNFSGDPGFVDPVRGDFHLRPGSVAIGRGRRSGAPCVDLDGRARLVDDVVDVGAYEFGAPYRLRPCPIIPPVPGEPASFGAR